MRPLPRSAPAVQLRPVQDASGENGHCEGAFPLPRMLAQRTSDRGMPLPEALREVQGRSPHRILRGTLRAKGTVVGRELAFDKENCCRKRGTSRIQTRTSEARGGNLRGYVGLIDTRILSWDRAFVRVAFHVTVQSVVCGRVCLGKSGHALCTIQNTQTSTFRAIRCDRI